MNKCYYCNNSQRGCSECLKDKQAALKPVWKLLDMGEAGESLKLVERHPIKDDRKLERVLGAVRGDCPSHGEYLVHNAAGCPLCKDTKGALLDADWATQVLWLKCVQHSLDLIDDSIRLELVREPSDRYPMLISRTNFEFMADRMQRTRAQAWSLLALYSSKAVMDDPELTAKFIAQWWELRRQKAYQQETSTPKGPASTKINFVPGAQVKVDSELSGTWEQLEPNVYPSVTDMIPCFGPDLTEMDLLTPHMRAPDPIHSMPLKALPREGLFVEGTIDSFFDSPELRAWINGSWDNLPDGDDQEDETLDAIYYGSRAGGKMLAHQEQVYREMLHAEAQQPMLLIHDEVTTYVDPESEYAKECAKPLNLQDLGKIVEKFEALSPESKRQVPNMRTLSIDLGSQPGWTTFSVGEYEMRLRDPNPYRINAVAARVGLYWQKRAIEMLEGIFKDNEPKD